MATLEQIDAFNQACITVDTFKIETLLQESPDLVNQRNVAELISGIIRSNASLDRRERAIELICTHLNMKSETTNNVLERAMMENDTPLLEQACTQNSESIVRTLLMTALHNNKKLANNYSTLRTMLLNNKTKVMLLACEAADAMVLRQIINASQYATSKSEQELSLTHQIILAPYVSNHGVLKLIAKQYWSANTLEEPKRSREKFAKYRAILKACVDRPEVLRAVLQQAGLQPDQFLLDEENKANDLELYIKQIDDALGVQLAAEAAPYFADALSEIEFDSFSNLQLFSGICRVLGTWLFTILLNGLVVFPLVMTAGLLTSAAIFFTKSIWFAVGVPIFYGIGNGIRLLTGQAPVKAPIGLLQWALHTAMLASIIFFPLAFTGVGVLSTTWFATTATPWIVNTAIPAISVALDSATMFLTTMTYWQSTTFSFAMLVGSTGLLTAIPYSIHSLKDSVSHYAKDWFYFFCPALKSEIKFVADMTEPQKAKWDVEVTSETFTKDAKVVDWLHDSRTVSNYHSAYRSWHMSLDTLTNGATSTVLPRPSPRPKN